MKIKLSESLTTFDGQLLLGQDEKPLTMGKAIANMLISPRQNGEYELDKIKLYILAQEMYTKDEMEIDDADIKHVIKIVETDTAYGPLVTGAVLLFLGNQTNKENK